MPKTHAELTDLERCPPGYQIADTGDWAVRDLVNREGIWQMYIDMG